MMWIAQQEAAFYTWTVGQIFGWDLCVESETEAAAGFDLAAAEATSIPAGGKAHAICSLAWTCLNSLLT